MYRLTGRRQLQIAAVFFGLCVGSAATALFAQETPQGKAPDSPTNVSTTNVSPNEVLQPLPDVFEKPAPENLSDLKQIEAHVRKLADKAVEYTVAVRVGNSQGSGVIVSGDGYILTAGHVSATPGYRAEVIFPDGKVLVATTKGRNKGLDSGLIKLNGDHTGWPHAELAPRLSQGEVGDWCLATGHPGGFRAERKPVLRLGRIMHCRARSLRTDCELVGGDSGGPLYDMRGRVIGIHSNISEQTTQNYHVPILAFQVDWDRLVAGEDFVARSGAKLGVVGKPHAQGLEITELVPSGAAEEAKLIVGDIIVTFQATRVTALDQLIELVGKELPDKKATLQYLHEGATKTAVVRLGYRED